MTTQQLTAKQVDHVLNLTGDSFQRELKKLAKIDPRLECKNGEFATDVLENILAELEADLSIDNDQNNETTNDQPVVTDSAPAKDDNEPVGTGLAGSSGELYFWPATNDYACKPYNSLTAIPKTVWDMVKSNFQPMTNIKKQALVKQQKIAEVKPTKYYAQFVINYSFETLDDLNGKQFDSPDDLIKFLTDNGIEYDNTDSEMLTIKRLHGQRTVGSTGTTKGGLSDPFERPDPSVPVSAAQIKAVKRGSSAHLALLALVDGINIKDKSEGAIARLNELADKNNCDRIEPSQFSWKFRQASLMNGYGHKLLGPNTYQLVLPKGLDTIKVK